MLAKCFSKHISGSRDKSQMFALRKHNSIAREESNNGPNAVANIGLAGYMRRLFSKWLTN